jgi:hypothetical protein
MHACPVDCTLSNWAPWQPCSQNCGGGSQVRTRTIDVQRQAGGAACLPLTDTRACQTQACPVDCTVSSWGAWGACTRSCNSGTRVRSRTQLQSAAYGGAACPSTQRQEACNTQCCRGHRHLPFGGCAQCPAGHYAAASGAHGCDPCPMGSFQPSIGATVCTLCPAGQFSNTTAQLSAASCVPCDVGHFAAAKGAATCTACAIGQYQSAQGATACAWCDAGSYSRVLATVQCRKCRKGHFQPGTGATDCKQCAAGRYNPAVGALSISACVACSSGKFTAFAGSGTCVACPKGQIQASEGQQSCNGCAAGRYMSSTGGSACVACVPGRWQALTAQSGCTACGFDRYSKVSGAATADGCKSCSAGAWSTWSTCSHTCAGGWKSRKRQLASPAGLDLEALDQCLLHQRMTCNEAPCPGQHECPHLTCQFLWHPTGTTHGHYTIRVDHHKKEVHNNHHCKMMKNASGARACRCFCWHMNNLDLNVSADEVVV